MSDSPGGPIKLGSESPLPVTPHYPKLSKLERVVIGVIVLVVAGGIAYFVGYNVGYNHGQSSSLGLSLNCSSTTAQICGRLQ